MGNTSAKPKLLFLCQTLPFPPDGGVQIRSYNILRILAAEFDVTALCFFRRATRPSSQIVSKGVDGLERLAKAEAFPIPQEHSRRRLLWDHVRSVAMQRAYTVFAYESSEFEDRLRKLIRSNHFDLVHMDSLDLSAYLPLLQGLPVACTHHNVESALLRRRASAEPSFVRRQYLALQARLVAKEERRWCPAVALNVVVSKSDGAELAPHCSPIEVVPNGVDTSYFQPSSSPSSGGIVFVGGYNWYPNRDGMEYFCERVLPLVHEKVGKALPITWVGRAPDDVRSKYSRSYGVELTGYVDDIRPVVHKAACYIAPLRVGGGSRLKILDAWAMGKAIVSTSIGCEGLDAEDGENILVRDTPESFASGIAEVLRDDRLRRKLEVNARMTAESTYEWDVVGKKIVTRYRRLLNSQANQPYFRPQKPSVL